MPPATGAVSRPSADGPVDRSHAAARERGGRDRSLLVLALSGALGYWVGSTAFPMWQVAVETAQVVAGLVAYPPDNPFYLYHTRLWTVLHQIGALLLRAGVSEITLSVMLSGVLGMVSVQALALVVYAFSRSVAWALAAPFIIVFSRAAEFGVAYPVTLVETPHTYGVMGLSTLVLSLALIAAGRYRLGGFLVGFVPAVHPALGVWLGITGAVTMLVRPAARLRELRPALPGFLLGAAATLVSLSAHLLFTADVPAVDPALTRPYFLAFVSFWDGHRLPVDFTRPGVWVNAGTILLGLFWLVRFPHDLPRPSLFLLRFAIASGVVGLATVPLSWVPPERLPMTVVILMPLRVLNIGVMAGPALLLGILGAYHHRLWALVLTIWTVVALTMTQWSMLWDILPAESWLRPQRGGHPLHVLGDTAVIMLAVVMVTRWRARHGVAPRRSGPGGRWRAALAAGLRVVPLALTGILLLTAMPVWRARVPPLEDRTNAPFFSALAAAGDVLLTGGDLYLVQLRTRRPVLINGGALDTVVYTPESILAAHGILVDVYGIDLRNPPADARARGIIPPGTNRAIWEAFTPERWSAIRRRYNVSEVLTESHWTLSLPVKAEGHGLRLYTIPE